MLLWHANRQGIGMLYLGDDDRPYQHADGLIHHGQLPVKGAGHRKGGEAAYALDSQLSMMLWAGKQKSASECRFLPVTK